MTAGVPRVLGLFARLPAAGQVKTRLAGTMGAEPAAALYQAFVLDVIERLRRVAERRSLCYCPPDAQSAAWFAEIGRADYDLWPQPAGPLGLRMARFFDDAFQSGASRAVIIGSDSPSLPVEFVELAFESLQTADCVVGPATDGGYYLIGLRRPLPVFEGIAFSRADVLLETSRRLRECGASLDVLPPWYDVDTADDLLLLRGHLALESLAGRPHELPQTEAVLRSQFPVQRI